MADTGFGNKHKPGALGGDPAASSAVTLRYPGHISNATLHGNDGEQLGMQLSFIVFGEQGEHLFSRRLSTGWDFFFKRRLLVASGLKE